MVIKSTTISNAASQIDEFAELKKKIQEKSLIVYVNHFTEASAKDFYTHFSKAHESGQSIIPIVIDSYGGAVDSLISMIDVIKSSEKPVATVCMGKAMSCGSVLLSCGNEGMRYMAPNSRVMIHNVASMAIGKTEHLKRTVQETERIEKVIFDIMDQNCGQRRGFFKDKIKDNLDLYLTAHECKKYNLINHIRVPKFNTKITVETELE